MSEEIQKFQRPIPLNSISDHWIEAYGKKRYMQALTNEELETRVADIISNLLVLKDDGKYRPQFNIREDGTYAPIRDLDFLRMAVDAWTELHLRGRLQTEELDRKNVHFAERLSDESWCRRPEWVERSRLSPDKYERPKMLFKFSEACWNKDFYASGRIRISPASAYRDSSLGYARDDDELSIESYDDTRTLWNVSVEDYYCACLSSTYDYRLYKDFLAEANQRSCVAINNPGEFSKRFLLAIERYNAEHPGSKIVSLRECPVIYVDPLFLPQPEKAEEVYFCKRFRYAYQAEYRYVLRPAQEEKIPPFFLELGSISDIAEYIEEPTVSASRKSQSGHAHLSRPEQMD